MEEIRGLLHLPLSRRVPERQLIDIESRAVYACEQYRLEEEKLADLRGRMYDPSGKTELERKINLERACREQQRVVDEWKDIVALIAQRIQLGIILLKES